MIPTFNPSRMDTRYQTGVDHVINKSSSLRWFPQIFSSTNMQSGTCSHVGDKCPSTKRRWRTNFHIFEVNISYAYLSYLSEITVITCRKSHDHDDDTGKAQLSTPYSQQSGGEVKVKKKKKMQVIPSTVKQDTSCYTDIYTDTCTYCIFEHWNDLSLSASVCEGEGDLGREI